MNRLLPLFLSLLGNLSVDSLQAILAKVVEKILPDIDDASQCRTQLLTWLRTGTLDDMLKSDPKAVLVCVGYVILGLVDQDHDHSPDAPIIVVGAGDNAENWELALLLGATDSTNVVGADDPSEESLPPTVWILLVQQLIAIMKKAIDEWTK